MIEIRPFVHDQQSIHVYGRRVGYCGVRAGMPVNFLVDRECKLNAEEKRQVILEVAQQVGPPRPTRQTERYFPDGGFGERPVSDGGGDSEEREAPGD